MCVKVRPPRSTSKEHTSVIGRGRGRRVTWARQSSTCPRIFLLTSALGINSLLNYETALYFNVRQGSHLLRMRDSAHLRHWPRPAGGVLHGRKHFGFDKPTLQAYSSAIVRATDMYDHSFYCKSPIFFKYINIILG